MQQIVRGGMHAGGRLAGPMIGPLPHVGRDVFDHLRSTRPREYFFRGSTIRHTTAIEEHDVVTKPSGLAYISRCEYDGATRSQDAK